MKWLALAMRAEAVRQFAQNGGSVIAMFTAGLADDYGKLENQAQLDHLFGIARADSKIQQSDWQIKGGALDGVAIHQMETGLKATDSQVLATADGKPVIFSANRGKGKVLYVACDLVSSYTKTNGSRAIKDFAARSAQTESFITQLLKESGAQPNFTISDKNNKPVPFTKTAHFTNGTADYYGIVRDYPMASGLYVQPETTTVRFPKKGYVYSVVSGKQFGLTDHVSMVLTSDSAELFSVLPYQVTGLEVTADQKQFAPGQTAALHFTVQAKAKVGTHILHVDVVDPSGNSSDVYSLNLTAANGEAAMALPFALNDKPGKWTVRVRDLTSGSRSEIALQMR